MPRKHYKILGVSGGVKDLWLLTNDGWVKSSKVLYYGLFNKIHLPIRIIKNLILLYRQQTLPYFPIYQLKKSQIKAFGRLIQM